MMPGLIAGSKKGAVKARAMELLESVGLANRANHRPGELSGGEQQRVAIARALIGEPQVIIADEPTAHLDSKLSLELLDILAGLNVDGKTIIIATHDPFVYQHPLIERTLEMSDGRLVGVHSQ
jgi:putative ABC transport system ATP-binding protein